MYYNRIIGVWVIDPLDYFLISACIGRILGLCLKNYLSEKEAMERLKNSIIEKSRLTKRSNSKLTNLPFNQSKLEKIYKVALNPNPLDISHGGDIEFNMNTPGDLEFIIADQIQDIILKLAKFLKQKELRAKLLKVLLAKAGLLLQLILARYRIELQYILVGAPLNPQVVVLATCTGGAAGFVVSWISAGAAIFTPSTIVSVFLVRGVAQQIRNNLDFKRILKSLNKALENEDIQEKFRKIVGQALEDQKSINNSNQITLDYLNWNKNPKIKEAAERLGIFENSPVITGRLNLDLLDPNSTKILEEMGVRKNPIPIKKAKTVYYRDFVRQIANDNSDLDIIDPEFVKESIKESIRVKNNN